MCPSLHPLLPFSIQSVPLSPKPNTTTPPPSSPPSLSSPPLPLAAFPTQSARRAASSPPGRPIPRRFRAIRRGFGAPLGVSRRIGGDRAPGRSGHPLIAETRCSVPAAWVVGLGACPRRFPVAGGASRCGERMNLLGELGAGWVGFDDRFASGRRMLMRRSRLRRGASGALAHGG